MAEFQQYLAILDSDPKNSQALEALETAVASDGVQPGNKETWLALDRTRQSLRERGELDVVAKLFDVELGAVRDDKRRAELLLEKGDFYVNDLLDDEGAMACFQQALELRPGDETAIDILAHIEMERENWEKFVQKNLDEAALSTDRALTTHMYLSAASYYARYRSDAEEVEFYLRMALEADPRNRKAAIHLQRLLTRDARWDELKALLGERAEVAATKEERVQALITLSELAMAHFRDPDLAVVSMENVASMDPAHPRALSMLADAYESREDWAALVQLYTGALKARRRDRARESELGPLLQIAMLYWKRLGDLDAAEEYFRRIRKAEPDHLAALDFYREYYPARGDVAQLLQVLRQAQKSVPAGEGSEERKRALSVEIAQVAEDHLGNAEKAIDAWKSILRAQPDSEDAREALKRLYRKTEKWNALLDMLKDEIERRPKDDLEGRVAGLMDVVAIYRDRLKLDVMVINTYNAILKLDPGNRQALDDLAAKYKELGRWNDLITVLSRKAELTDLPVAERAAMLHEIASLWSERFGNFAQAVRPLELLVELVPSDREATGRLKDIYTRRRQWRALLDLLAREASILAPDERREKLVEMASLAAERLGDNRLAIELWNRVLELPRQREADDDQGQELDSGLARGLAGNLAFGDEEALAALALIYEREKRYHALAEIYRRQRALAEDEAGQVAILEKLGGLFADRLDAPEPAAEAFREILALQPSHARALRTLRELYASAGDYQALEFLYAGLGQWDELVESFHAIADRLDDRDAKLALFERTAALAAQHLDKPDKVARAYERVLSVDPKHLASAHALVPVYEATRKWARLLSTYEILLEYAEDNAARLDLHLKIRDLCETKLNSKALAFQWSAKAFRLEPERPELLAELERLGAEADQWDQVAEILDQRVQEEDIGAQHKLALLRELGKIAAVRLHEPERARAYQRQVLELSPDDPEAMTALEEIAMQLSEWPDLLKVYRRRVELADDDDAKVELLFKIAFIEEERLADFDETARTYKRVLELAPDSQRAMRALAKLQEARGDWEGLTEVLVRQLRSTADTESQVALLLRIGTLRETSLNQAEAALDAYCEALDLDPAAKKVHKALERFLDQHGSGGTSSAARVGDERRAQVAELLLPIFEQADDAARIARALDVLRTSADDFERLEHNRRLTVLYSERLGDKKRAYAAALRVLDADPLDADIRQRLLDLSGALGRDEHLAEALSRALEASEGHDDAVGRRALATELARLYDDSLRTPEKAETAWQAVLELPGGDPESDAAAYDALDRIYRTAGRWKDLRDLLLRREDATLDNEVRKSIVLAVCDLEEGVLDNPDGAIEAYKRVLDIDPAYMRAYKALERLHDDKEQYVELEELIGRELEHVEDDGEQIQLTYRRAELRARHLDQLDGAVDQLEEVITRKSRHSEARKLLEELMKRHELRLRISRILEPIYERDNNWRDLCLVLRAQREFAGGSHEAAALLSRVATVQEEQLGDDRSAFATWIETFKVEPREEASREAVRRLASMLDRWNDAAQAYEDTLDTADSGDVLLRGELLVELASVYDRQLVDTGRAISAYRRLLDLDPGNPETARPATQALARLYEEEQHWNDLIEILRRQADWADSTDERKSLLSRVAMIEEAELDGSEAAIATWREVLAEDPEDAAALDALERLYTAGDKAIELIEILRRRVELAQDPWDKKVHLGRVADLCEQKLSEPTDAITAHLEVLDYVPDDRDTLIELSRLYRGLERYPDLLDILERRLSGSTEEDEALELTYQIGRLLQDHLSREAEALERYAEVLTLQRIHPGALEAIEGLVDDAELRRRSGEILEPLYEISGEHEKLASLLLRLAEGNDDVRETLRCLRQVARIREDSLGDSSGALEVAVRAVRVAVSEPELPELIDEVARLATDLGRMGDLIDIYQEIAPDVFDGELQRRLYLDVADLARAVRQDVELARDYYQRVLDAQPDDRRALNALESIYRAGDKHAELYDILIRKAELAGNDLDAQASSLAEAAALCADHLDRADDAILAWEQVLDITPENKTAVKALEKLYEESDRWHELVELLERRLGYAFTVEEAVKLRYRLGEIHEDKLHDPEAAVENYSAALGGDPGHRHATEALERFLDDPGLRNAAADVLEQIYVGQQDWLKLVRIYEIKLEAADDPAERLDFTRHLARLYEEQLEDLQQAARWYGRVFREAPGDGAVRDQLARLAAILDSWGELANVYQDFLNDELGATPEVAIVARLLGDIYNERLDEIERGMAAYRRVLEIAPDDRVTFERLEGMLVRGQRWHALVEVYEEAISATMDDERRQDLYIRQARAHESHLDDPARAIDAYRAVLDINQDHAQAVAELERLFQEQSQWFDLSELLQARIERSEDVEQMLDYRMRLAEVMETRLDDTLGGIEQYEIVLRTGAWRQALPALERLIVNEEYRERIAEMLEPIYRSNDWWQKLVVILDTQVSYVEDPARRVEMLREIAHLHESRGGDENLALDALARAWLEDVHGSDVYSELSALAAKLQAWDKLVETLQKGVEDEYDYDLVASILSRVAEIHDKQRQDTESAIRVWRRVLEVKDDEPLALTALDRLLATEGRFEELVEIVKKRAELADGQGIRLVMLHRIAALYQDELAQPAEAITAYRNVLAVDDRDREALDALERLYRSQEEWPELVEILARKIELSESPSDRRELRFQAAAVHEEKLSDSYEAVALYNAVADEDPTDREALGRLDELYARESMWPELVEVLDRRADLELENQRRAELAFRAARVVESELIEPDNAIARYASVLDLWPEHQGARQALDAMLKSEDTLERAAAVLEALYRSDGDYEALADLFERKLAIAHPDPDVRKQQYAALAEVYEVLQGELDAAFAVWARALAEAPEDFELQSQLDRLTAMRGNWEELAALLEERLIDIVDAELEYAYATKLASLYEDALDDLVKAAAKYRQALEVAADEREPLRALDRIYTRAARYEDLAEILAREAEATSEEIQQCEYLFRLGDVRERALYDLAGAVTAYSDVLERAPEHIAARTAMERLLLSAERERPAVISILEPLYENEADYARLADLLTAKLSITADNIDRAQIYSRVAELAENQLGDHVRALDATGGWLAEDPRSEEALVQLHRLAEAVGRWGEVAARLFGIIDSADSDDVRRGLLGKLGAIQLDKLGDARGAEDSFKRLLDIDSEAVGALESLQRIYRGRGDAAALASALWRLGELTYDAPQKRAYFVEVATLREQLDDSDGAIQAWSEVLELDEGDRQALDRLVVIYERRQDWQKLIDTLGQAALHAADVREERAIKTRIAILYSDTLGQLDDAVSAWQAVLDVVPDAVDALVALEQVHARREDWPAVQEALTRRLDLLDSTGADKATRIGLLHQLAKLSEDRLEAMDEAVGHLFHVLDIDNAHAETYAELERLLSRAERWHDLVELLARHGDVQATMGDIDGEVRCLARAADVWEGALENPDAAGEILEKILRRDPNSVPALTRLAKIYERAGDWERCGQVLQRALALGPRGRDAAELFYRLGEVAMQRDSNVEQATNYWGQALHADGGYLPAVEAMEKVGREQANWPLVANMLTRRERMITDQAAKLELTLELAEIYRIRLGQPEQVIPLLEQAASVAPEDTRVQTPLADLYFAAGRHDEAAPIYERLADEARKKRQMKEVAMYRQRLGGIFEAKGQTDEALASYEEAFRVNPTDVATMAGLGRLYLSREMWDKARRVYRSMVLQNLDPDCGVTKAEVYYNLGIIHVRLDEASKAKGMFQRGLEIEPDNDKLKQALASLG
jgi:golgin subfamily B member 1